MAVLFKIYTINNLEKQRFSSPVCWSIHWVILLAMYFYYSRWRLPLYGCVRLAPPMLPRSNEPPAQESPRISPHYNVNGSPSSDCLKQCFWYISHRLHEQILPFPESPLYSWWALCSSKCTYDDVVYVVHLGAISSASVYIQISARHRLRFHIYICTVTL